MAVTEFLLARIADDEERAKFVERQMSDWDRANPFEQWRLSWQDEYNLLCVEPSRALAECGAKRRIVSEHPPTDPINHEGDRYCRRCLAHDFDTGYPDEWVQDYYPCPTLRLLALPYADHPDYRQEWKP